MTSAIFGRELRKGQFPHHDQSLVRLNNGSFGACPKVVLEFQHKENCKWLANPDDVWHLLKPKFDDVSLSVARNILGDESLADDVFMVDNLTAAFAVVAESLLSTIQDSNSVVIMSNFTYNAVCKAVYYTLDNVSSRFEDGGRVSVVVVDLPFPIITDDGSVADEAILDAYRSALQLVAASGKRPVVAIIDHISSLPCMVLPIQRIITLLREHGVEEVS